MPAITNSKFTILVTGANGFLATWIVGDLLKRGYSVKAAVRAEPRGKHLLETYKSYGEKLQPCAVGDIAKEGAFDEAVKGVDGIIHTASPVHLKDLEPKEFIEPAVNGILGVLTSTLKFGPSVQRIVFSSSCAAIRGSGSEPGTYSEADWNNAPVRECEEKGKDAAPLSKYCASKTLAEKAAWDFCEKHKAEIGWDLAAINPPWIFGPAMQDVTTYETLNDSNKWWYNAVVKDEFGGLSPLSTPSHGWVDVHDVSEAHVRALETPAAGGGRIIVCAESPYVWQDWVDVANSLTPAPLLSRSLAKGMSGTAVRNVKFDAAKENRILGMKYKTMEETARDMLADFDRRGW